MSQPLRRFGIIVVAGALCIGTWSGASIALADDEAAPPESVTQTGSTTETIVVETPTEEVDAQAVTTPAAETPPVDPVPADPVAPPAEPAPAADPVPVDPVPAAAQATTAAAQDSPAPQTEQTVASTTASVATTVQSPSTSSQSVTFCHAHPADAFVAWVQITTNVHAFFQSGHPQHAGDIVAPFTYSGDHGQPVAYAGSNWTAAGQAIMANGCDKPDMPTRESIVETQSELACAGEAERTRTTSFTFAWNDVAGWVETAHVGDWSEWMTLRALSFDELLSLECIPTQPPDEVTPLSEVEADCTVGEVWERAGTLTASYAWHDDLQTWQAGAGVEAWGDWTFVRALTLDERIEIGCVPAPPDPVVDAVDEQELSCTESSTRTGTVTTGWIWVEETVPAPSSALVAQAAQVVGEWVPAEPGAVVWQDWTSTAPTQAQLAEIDCPLPPVVDPPAEEPPAADPPAEQPAPPAAQEPPAAPAPQQDAASTLPVTGAEPWLPLGVAGLLALLVGVASLVRRRVR